MIKITKNAQRIFAYGIGFFSLLGCNVEQLSQGNDIPETQQQLNQSKNSTVIATLNHKVITLAEIDKKIQIKLFDLEWRKYELRKAALKKELADISQQTQNNSHKIDISLIPPTPPRIQLPKDNRAVKGNPTAPIRLSLFCSYQSSQCARLQPVIKELEIRYNGFINIAFYDLPQSYHRYGKLAANAVHCATDFSSPWDFQSALYSDINQLNLQRFSDIAKQLNFNNLQFQSCIKSQRHFDKINKDLTLSQNLGLSQVPVLLVEGLYVKGPQTTQGFSFYIQQELNRLGLFKPVASTLPIELLATEVKDAEKDSRATLAFTHGSSTRPYQIGDTVQEQVTLLDIEEQKVIINNAGKMEFILLKQNSISQLFSPSAVNLQPQVTEIESSENSPTLASLKGQPYDPSLAVNHQSELKATGNMRLSKEWLNPHLNNKDELQKHFHVAEHQVEGAHLLKLNGIERQGFYRTLGLQEGDVVLRVNQEWVHDQHNPLWQALEHEEDVTLTVMRGGYPVRYDYQIK